MNAPCGFEIFVVCDRHPRAQAVTNYIYDGTTEGRDAPEGYYIGGWIRGGRSRDGHVQTNVRDTRLMGNEVYDFGTHGDARRARSNIELSCRRCNASISIREEKLYPILTTLASNGVSVVSLHGLSAIL